MYSIKTYLIQKFRNEYFSLKLKNKRYCYTKGGGGGWEGKRSNVDTWSKPVNIQK